MAKGPPCTKRAGKRWSVEPELEAGGLIAQGPAPFPLGSCDTPGFALQIPQAGKKNFHGKQSQNVLLLESLSGYGLVMDPELTG